jgi:hypothetical protein
VVGWGLGALEKNFNIPSFLFNCKSISESDGAEERSEESDMVLLLSQLVGDVEREMWRFKNGRQRRSLSTTQQDNNCGNHWLV